MNILVFPNIWSKILVVCAECKEQVATSQVRLTFMSRSYLRDKEILKRFYFPKPLEQNVLKICSKNTTPNRQNPTVCEKIYKKV